MVTLQGSKVCRFDSYKAHQIKITYKDNMKIKMHDKVVEGELYALVDGQVFEAKDNGVWVRLQHGKRYLIDGQLFTETLLFRDGKLESKFLEGK